MIFVPSMQQIKIFLNFLAIIVLNEFQALTQEPEGHPVQLLTFSENNTMFSLNKIVAEEILMKDEVKNRTVAVVSIAGALRKGKSFLLSFFLRYLDHTYKKMNRTTKWIGERGKPLNGFKWKLGQNRVTSGILMWSEIFKTTLKNGEEVAIILLDTQGLFDHYTTFEVNSKIFALSTAISSVQIYNVMHTIEENDLQLLKLFTDYGSQAANVHKNTTISRAPFQTLLFLIRDWFNSHETPYGRSGGRQFIEKIFNVTDKENRELQTIRNDIKSCFSQVDCFLMPFPGEDVAGNPNFDGRLEDISDKFKDSLEELIPSLLSPENLVLKQINGVNVKASDFIANLVLYVDKLNSKTIPTPKGIFEANAELAYREAYEAAIDYYTEAMNMVCGISESKQPEELLRHHFECVSNASARFHSFSKFDDDFLQKSYKDKLDENFLQRYELCKREQERRKANGDATNRKACAAALEVYKTCAQTVCGDTESYVEVEDLANHYHRCKTIASEFLVNYPKSGGSYFEETYNAKLEKEVGGLYKSCKKTNELLKPWYKKVRDFFKNIGRALWPF